MKKLVIWLMLVLSMAVWAGDSKDVVVGSKKGSERGDVEAQFAVAVMHEKGIGTLQDHAEAVRFYKLAAEQGHLLAQHHLAWKYDGGDGVVQDHAEAVRWFKLAATQGDSSAQFTLALKYGKGEGVLQDFLQAHMWANLAAASGFKKATGLRGVIAGGMTPQQIAEAQGMAKRCKASQFRDCD